MHIPQLTGSVFRSQFSRIVQYIGRDVARVDSIGQDALATALGGNTLGQPQHRQFGGLVCTEAGVGPVRGDAADGDEGPMMMVVAAVVVIVVRCLEHEWKKGAREKVRSQEVDLHRAPPDLRVAVGNGARAEHARVVDHNINAPERVLHRRDGLVHTLPVCDVNLDSQDLGLRLAGGYGCLLRVLDGCGEVAACADGDVGCAGLGKGYTHGPTETPAGTTDEHSFALQVGLGRIDCWVRVIVDD